MSKGPILRHYVSPTDEFLLQFDRNNPKLSLSQLQEKQKYARIYALRDEPEHTENKPLLEWLE